MGGTKALNHLEMLIQANSIFYDSASSAWNFAQKSRQIQSII